MSLIIGGVSVGGALAAGAATAVASNVVGGMMGGGGGAGGAGAAAADPFASQRPQYQTQLQTLMGSQQLSDRPDRYEMVDKAYQFQNSGKVDVPGQTTGGRMMQEMLTPGYTFDSSDPSYKFRLEQGAGALASSNAARGLLNSGAAATALVDYGQGMASTEYQSQFNRASAQDTSAQRLGQNTFTNQMSQLQYDQNARQGTFDNMQSLNNNLYTQLAQLSGANSGSTAAAGQLVASGQANAAAGANQIVQPVVNAISEGVGNWWNSNTTKPAVDNTVYYT